MSTYTSISCFVLIGCISTSFAHAVEVSKCYRVNGQNYCFYTNGSESRWNEARKFCEDRNSTLPIITDEDIDNVFQQFIVSDSYNVIENRYVWIDAHARPVNNSVSWHWINRQPSALTPSNHRDNVNDKWCLSIGKDDPEPRLYENHWTYTRHYVCQYNNYDNDAVQQFSSTTTSTSTVNCSPRWIVYHNSYTTHPYVNVQGKTQQQCLDECAADTTCVAAEWHTASSRKYCRMHRKMSQRSWYDGITRFEIVRQCHSTSGPSCEDAFQINSTCYKIHKEEVSWFTAVNRCLSNNASLAVFDDDVHQYFPSNLLSNKKAWIGLVKSWWTWPGLDGTDVLYNKFNVTSSSPPDNPPARPNSEYNCVVATAGQWRLSHCDEQHRVVCQSDYNTLPEPSTTQMITTEITSIVPSSSFSSTSSPPKTDDASAVGLAVGVAVALVVLIIIVVVVVVVVFVLRRRRSQSSRTPHDNHPLQQQPQHQHGGDENAKSTDDNNVYERSQPDLIYANIVPDEKSNSPEVTSLMTGNNALIYSALEDSDVGTKTVAPSDDLYANVSP